jgi:hypothetical protein
MRHCATLLFCWAHEIGSVQQVASLHVRDTVRLTTLPLANLYLYPMADVAQRNPGWDWDENVLACNLVGLKDCQQIGSEDLRELELPGLLRRMPLHPLEAQQHYCRNTNDAARKTTYIPPSHPDCGEHLRPGLLRA